MNKKPNTNDIILSDKISTIKSNECYDIKIEILKKVKNGDDGGGGDGNEGESQLLNMLALYTLPILFYNHI